MNDLINFLSNNIFNILTCSPISTASGIYTVIQATKNIKFILSISDILFIKRFNACVSGITEIPESLIYSFIKKYESRNKEKFGEQLLHDINRTKNDKNALLLGKLLEAVIYEIISIAEYQLFKDAILELPIDVLYHLTDDYIQISIHNSFIQDNLLRYDLIHRVRELPPIPVDKEKSSDGIATRVLCVSPKGVKLNNIINDKKIEFINVHDIDRDILYNEFLEHYRKLNIVK